MKNLQTLIESFQIELKKELYEIIADHSDTDYKKVWKDGDRDYWMTAQEAKDYGMIDEIV